MSFLPYTLILMTGALILFGCAWMCRGVPLWHAVMKGIGSLFFLVGTALVTPWLYELAFQIDDNRGEIIAPIIFIAIPVALLGSLSGVLGACKTFISHSIK